MWLALVPAALAQELSGFAEARVQLSGGLEGKPWQTVQVLRPAFDVEPHPRVRLHTTVQASLVQGRYPVEEGYAVIEEQLGSALEYAGCSLDAPDRYSSADDVLLIDRFYVDLYGKRADLRVGRQAINWGSALFLNPTDLFAEVLVNEPWRQRAGVDGARLTVPVGDRAQLVGVGGISRDLNSGRAGLKATVNALGTDFSALGAVISDFDDSELFVGFDVKGTAVVGFWAEGRTSLNEPALVVSTGLDYSFDLLDQVYVAAQYTYDGTGLEDPALYTLEARGGGTVLPDCAQEALAEEELQPTAARFTLGRHYGLVTAQVSAWEDWGLSLAALMNLQDRSTVLIPNVSWRPGGAWNLNLGAQIPLGEGEFSPGAALTTLPLGQAGSLDLSGLFPEWTAFAWARYSL